MSSRIARFLKKRDFLRSALVLVSGTALAQVVTLAVLPLLTRLYTPADFSILAVYMGVVAIFSSAACLGFDMAIPMPEADHDARHLLVMAVISALVVSALIGLVIWCVDFSWGGVDILARLGSYRWLLPAGILFTAVFGAMQFYAVRRKAFLDIAKARVWQSLAGGLLQCGGAIAHWTPGALIVGPLVGTSTGVFHLLHGVLSLREQCRFRRLRLAKARSLAWEYRRFPQFTTFESLANNMGIQLPVILIAMIVAGPEAGFLLLAMRAMQTPIGMVGGAVGQVYLSKAPQHKRDRTLADLTFAVISGAIKMGAAPIAFLGVIAPGLFDWVFGEGWSRAGELVAWMTPWFLLQYLASPISMIMHVQRCQRMMLQLTCVGLVVRVGALLASAVWFPAWLSEMYALSGMVFYLLCFIIFTKAAGLSGSALARLAGVAIVCVSLGSAGGVLMNLWVGW